MQARAVVNRFGIPSINVRAIIDLMPVSSRWFIMKKFKIEKRIKMHIGPLRIAAKAKTLAKRQDLLLLFIAIIDGLAI